MKNLNLNRNLLKIFFLFLLLTVNFGFGQMQINENVNQKLYKVISFGEKIFFAELDNNITWTIANTKENIFIKLTGNEINNYVFEHIGIYEINYSDNKQHVEGECNHAKFDDKMLVKVSDVKMHFDFSKIKFSEKIRTGNNCDGIIISVPVDVKLKQNITSKFKPSQIMVAGVGSNIIAKPITQEVNLQTGTLILKYRLSGTATKETYLMFDFIDYNNNVQTYNQTEIVN